MHEIVERTQGFLDRRAGVGDVLVVEVDIVGAEPLEAGFDRADDVAARGALQPPPLVHGTVHRTGEFGREHDVVPSSGQCAAEIFLGPAALAVGIGGVEKRDAEIERLVHDGTGCRHVHPPAEIVAPEPDRRDDQAGPAQIALFQYRSSDAC